VENEKTNKLKKHVLVYALLTWLL